MRRLLLVAAGLIALYLVVSRWPDAAAREEAEQPSSHSAGFAHQLFSNTRLPWRTHPFTYGHIHFREHSYAAQTRNSIARATDSAVVAVLRFLEVADTFPIEVFFVDDRREMQELVGRPIGGMVQSGERTAILVANTGYPPFLVHELTHLYTHNHWGRPRSGRWISEGIAALASGDCQGHTVASLVKGFYEDGRIHPWSEFIADFESMDEVSANLQAASMVEFIKRGHGIQAVREIWLSEDVAQGFRRVLDRDVASVERAWLDSVRAHGTSGRLDMTTLRERGCW